MKQTLAVMCIVALALFAIGCEEPEEARAREEVERAQWLQSNANKVIGDIQYIKDPRTGLCFAYYWGDTNFGGPALATVPCEAVPPELLTVAK